MKSSGTQRWREIGTAGPEPWLTPGAFKHQCENPSMGRSLLASSCLKPWHRRFPPLPQLRVCIHGMHMLANEVVASSQLPARLKWVMLASHIGFNGTVHKAKGWSREARLTGRSLARHAGNRWLVVHEGKVDPTSRRSYAWTKSVMSAICSWDLPLLCYRQVTMDQKSSTGGCGAVSLTHGAQPVHWHISPVMCLPLPQAVGAHPSSLQDLPFSPLVRSCP